ncbi:MAG TPA: methionyl-tRNA formyltransferase, partial [Crocinitomicaceae bacterium]|nr:methionyl-tRNA formyltransferase [Crocinitomicaceae bacterium]
VDAEMKPAPKIFKQDCKIDFSNDVQTVHNFCRGLSPYPASWCTLYNKDKNESKTYKLFASEKTGIDSVNHIAIKTTKEGLLFPCADNYLLVKEIQMEGKRKMNFKDFLAGNSIENLSILEA